MAKTLDTLTIAEVIVSLRNIRRDYADSAKWCEENGKASGVKFNTRRTEEIDDMIATLKAAMK